MAFCCWGLPGTPNIAAGASTASTSRKFFPSRSATIPARTDPCTAAIPDISEASDEQPIERDRVLAARDRNLRAGLRDHRQGYALSSLERDRPREKRRARGADRRYVHRHVHHHRGGG